MTESEYREQPAISRSELWQIRRSPLHFRYEMDHPQPPTESQLFGQAFHASLLQPDVYASMYPEAPQVDRRTKAGKEAWEAFLAGLGEDAAPIPADMAQTIRAMGNAVLANPYAARLLEGAHETPHFWVDELTGEACKCRTDVETSVGGIHLIVDVKTCADASTDAFRRSCLNYGYDFQAAMYREGVKADTGRECGFVFLAVEKNPPYGVNLLQADALMLLRGQDIYRELLGIYHQCKVAGDWYGYNGFSGAINNLGLPPWLARDYE